MKKEEIRNWKLAVFKKRFMVFVVIHFRPIRIKDAIFECRLPHFHNDYFICVALETIMAQCRTIHFFIKQQLAIDCILLNVGSELFWLVEAASERFQLVGLVEWAQFSLVGNIYRYPNLHNRQKFQPQYKKAMERYEIRMSY